MRFSILAAVLVLTAPIATASADDLSPTLDLMPVPARIDIGSGAFTIDEEFAVLATPSSSISRIGITPG